MGNQGDRDARPLPPRALSALHDAIEEEIEQNGYKYALPIQLAKETGLRKRLVTHYVDEWREDSANGKQIVTPKLTECTIEDSEGCYKCNQSRTSGPDGYLKPKTGKGQQRAIPVPDSFYDFYKDKRRDTNLNERLDKYFAINDNFQIGRSTMNNALKAITVRRHDEIAEHHQGAKDEPTRVPRCSSKRTVPDVHFHDLRATWATQCLRSGVDQTTVMDWGGWKEANMINHYRGFVGDPTGEQTARLEGTSDEITNVTGNGEDVLTALQEADITDEQMAQIVKNL